MITKIRSLLKRLFDRPFFSKLGTNIRQHSALIRLTLEILEKFSETSRQTFLENTLYIRFIEPFVTKIQAFIQPSHIRYIRYGIVSVAVLVVGVDAWKTFKPSELSNANQSVVVHPKPTALPQPDLPELPVPKPAKKTEEEIFDEEEGLSEPPPIEETHLWDESPWSVLKTGLPARYYKSSYRDEDPVVAFILVGLGLNKAWTTEVLTKLHGDITIAISPYSQNITDQLLQAESLGYQGIIGMPMEPYDYPNPDPGPLTILTGVTPDENRHVAKFILSKSPKGTSVIGEHGSRFTISLGELEPVLKQIQRHGGIFVDPRTTLHSRVPQACQALNMPCHQVDMTIPLSMNKAEADEFLKKIIQNAKENGTLIVSVPAIPAFIDFLLDWIDALSEEGISLSTISDLPPMESKPVENGIRQDLPQPR